MIFRRDPCGLVCISMIYLFITYADYVVLIWLLLPTFKNSYWTLIHGAVFNVLLVFSLIAHAKAMLTDPGVVPISKTRNSREAKPKEYSSDESESDEEAIMQFGGNSSEWTLCTRCESLRPPRAHHCRVCKRCVRKMDHHCPWVNNCVGEYNQKHFLQFILYTGMSCTYGLFLLTICWVYDDAQTLYQRGPFGDNVHHSKVIHSIIFAMECALFGLFVLAVSCDQLGAIFTDETAIESVQRRGRNYLSSSRRPRSSKVAMLRQVCGTGPKIFWLIPCFTARRAPTRHIRSHHQMAHFDV
ncbi:unnamed protein product [Caenorhabditis angaria]|uniref:Palmitoyltransferase n=1 Tax=Caenorhabditis angaria TaxID=860376 RepID=A0A9P1I333_9PELO|nr:unnamed protein product [Caenorhabditis angaria]